MININQHRLRDPCVLALILSTATSAAVGAPDDAPRSLEPSLELPGKVWAIDRDGLEIRLTQLPRDLVRAFFQGRGFSAEHSGWIADSCVFQTIVRNTRSPTDKVSADIDLRRWRLLDGSGTHALKLKPVWKPIWQQAGVSGAARIAFRWALFPTEQNFFPGDYNWGMTTFGPEPGALFDLELQWSVAGIEYTDRIEQIECPAE